MERRTFLKQLGLVTMAMGGAGSRQMPVADERAMSAVIEFSGNRYEFREDRGDDLGDFHGEGFVQRCIRSMIPQLPLTVFFRPDRTSGRTEVVFELGRLWGTANAAAAHLGPYKVTIFRGGRMLASVDVIKHWWMSRWRWQSGPRPVVHTPEQLIAARLLFPPSEDWARMVEPIRFEQCVYRYPMDNAGIHYDMGDTGERPDIGPLTEWQACYVNTRSEDALAAVLAQGEAAGSMPTHYRDERTGAPIDFMKYPEATWYYTAEGKNAIAGYDTVYQKGDHSAPWRMDVSHEPTVSFLPAILTGDPYFLEELQFQATQALGWTAYFRGLTKLLIVDPGQTRGFAWSLRTVFHAARATPASTPKWLKPKAYWNHILDDNRKWFTETYLKGASAASNVFHAGTQLGNVASWQEEFLAFVLGWGVWMGFEDWRDVYSWKLRATLARTNGKSGWPRQYCSPYYYKIGRSEPDTIVDPNTVDPRIWFGNWKEAWEAFVVDPKRANSFVSGRPGEFTDATSYQETEQNDYLVYTRGVLATATRLGVKEAVEPYEFVDNMARQRRYMTNRWAYAAAGH